MMDTASFSKRPLLTHNDKMCVPGDSFLNFDLTFLKYKHKLLFVYLLCQQAGSLIQGQSHEVSPVWKRLLECLYEVSNLISPSCAYFLMQNVVGFH